MTQTLISILGGTPQLVTETLYALHMERPALLPDRIEIITTSFGERGVRQLLGDDGQIRAFALEYGLLGWYQGLADNIHVHVPKDADGPLADVDTVARGRVMHQAIFQIVASACADGDAQVHVSLAGGRKTMSFIAGQALSLFGRKQDLLTHVLLNPQLETQPKFFFPPKVPIDFALEKPGGGFTGNVVNTADARVLLAEIAFVRLRQLVPRLSTEQLLDPSMVIASVQKEVTPRLVIGAFRYRKATFRGLSFKLPLSEFAFMVQLAEALQRHNSDPAEDSFVLTIILGKQHDMLRQRALFAVARVEADGLMQGRITEDPKDLYTGEALALYERFGNKAYPNNPLSERWSNMRTRISELPNGHQFADLFIVEKGRAALNPRVEVTFSDPRPFSIGELSRDDIGKQRMFLARAFPDVPEAIALIKKL